MKMSDGTTIVRVPPHYAQLAAALGLNSQMEAAAAAAAAVTNNVGNANCVITPTDFETLIEIHRKQQQHHLQQQHLHHHLHHINHQPPPQPQHSEQFSIESSENSNSQSMPPPPPTLIATSAALPPPPTPVWDQQSYSKNSASPLQVDQPRHSPAEYQQHSHHHQHHHNHQQQQHQSPQHIVAATSAAATPPPVQPPPSLTALNNNMEICNENKLHRQKNSSDTTMDVDVDGEDDNEQPHISAAPASQHPHNPTSTPSPTSLTTTAASPSLHLLQPAKQSRSCSPTQPHLHPPPLSVSVQPSSQLITSDGNVDSSDCPPLNEFDGDIKKLPISMVPSKKSHLINEADDGGSGGLKENHSFEQNQNNQNLLNQNCELNNGMLFLHPSMQHHHHLLQHNMHHLPHHLQHHLLHNQQIDENMWRPW